MYWPASGEIAFKKTGERSAEAHLDWFGMTDIGFMARGFLEAANAVVDQAVSGGCHADKFFFPAAYLYRHALELQLKALVRSGFSSSSQTVPRALNDHKLAELWALAKPLIIARWPDGDPETIAAAESILFEFDKYDKTGQAFRYTHDKSGAAYLQAAPRAVDLSALKTATAGCFTFLSSCENSIEEQA